MKNRLSSRLRLTLSGVTLLTLLLMCALVFAGMYFQTTADNREQLRQQAVQLSSYLEASDDPVSLLQGSVFTQRVTYLDTDGTVLYDSEVDASRLESHAGAKNFSRRAKTARRSPPAAAQPLGKRACITPNGWQTGASSAFRARSAECCGRCAIYWGICCWARCFASARRWRFPARWRSALPPP